LPVAENFLLTQKWAGKVKAENSKLIPVLDFFMKEEKSGDATEPEGVRKHLQELREALLHLHKTLIESERVGYEKTIGRIQSPNHFFQLLTSDPWFAWLNPFSQLIVAMDEALDGKEPLTQSMANALAGQIFSLLVATEEGHGFAKHYADALQRDPDVVLAHAEVAKLRLPMKK
jgi:hypothetical protein